jgi:serine/threonine protein kinase
MAWQVGEKLKDGRYTIEQVLGHSGFGQTYVALRNTSNSERVVLKHLKKEDGEDDKTFRDRQTAFTNEAIRLASCEHSHIVKVRPETFWEGDLVHMVMEHIQGENLEVLVKQRQKPLPLDEALRYIAQVASALEHIHNFDPPLIHRDVKPANIVLRSKNQEAVLVDFGSAKEVRTDASLSQKATFTPAYSPIEIYSGVKKDTYTDVYSLGATIYFLLTNREPSPSQERVIEDVPPPIELNPHVSQRVNDAIMAAMAIKPQDRVQTVTEFMQRLGKPLKPSIIHQGLGLFGAKVAPSNQKINNQIVFEQQDHLDFRSAKERDYQELEELLEYQQWSMADGLTAKLMLKDDNHCLDEESIKIFRYKSG